MDRERRWGGEGDFDEVSFGVIPFRRVTAGFQVLMIQHRAGHWAFPKGHPEPGETEDETAMRELEEETGLSARELDHDVRFREIYRFERGGTTVRKAVIYFPVRFEGDEPVKIQAEELRDARWVAFDEARRLASFDECRAVIDKVETWMKSEARRRNGRALPDGQAGG